MSDSKLHANTRFRAIDLADMRFEFDSKDPMHTFKVFLPDGTMIQSNLGDSWHKFKNNEGFRYFLIDNKDFANMEKVWEECKTPKEKDQRTEEYLGTVTKFSKFFPKQICVRLIPPLTVGSEEEKRVFADEVMEIIPIVLEQQKARIPQDDARLVAHRIKCAQLPFECAYRTYSVSEFEKILNEFDIDKSLIMLIPDPSYEMSRRNYISRGGYIRLFAPDKRVVSDMYQAANHVFTCVVMGKNWRNEDCKKHKKCNENMKPLIMKSFLKILTFSDFWLECTKQYQFIEWIRRQCAFSHHSGGQNPDYIMDRTSAEVETDIDNYNLVVNHFDLPKYPVFPPAVKNKQMPVWMHRLLCKLGWIQQFFSHEDSQEVKNMMLENLFFMVPEQHVSATREFVNKVKNGSISALKNEPPSRVVADDQSIKMLTARLKRDAIIKKKKEEAKQKKKGTK